MALAQPTADGRPPTAASPIASLDAAVDPATPHAPTQIPEATQAAVVGGRPSAVASPYARIADLPIIPQKFNNCGPTNLTIVLNHYGVDVDQFDVAAVARPNYEDRNVSPGELVAYVREQTGLAAEAYAGGRRRSAARPDRRRFSRSSSRKGWSRTRRRAGWGII